MADVQHAGAVHPDLEPLVRARPTVLVFIPNTNELQRFVLSGAFDALATDHALHYVLPEQDAEQMRAAAPAITVANSSALHIPADRFAKWKEIFEAGCRHYAHLSPSFALRHGLEVNPAWRESWRTDGEVDETRQVLDREFDARVDQLLDGMDPLPALAELFDRFMPVYCVIPTSLLDAFCNEVVWACESEHVVCLLLQSGWDNLSSKGLLYWRTPFLGCWGPQSLHHAVVLQRLPYRRLAQLGAPHYEFLRPASESEVGRLRATLGVADDERLVLFGGSFRQFDETSILRELERATAKGRFGKVKFVYRPHPWRAARKHERDFFDYEWSHVIFDPDMRGRYVREQEEPGYIKRDTPMFDMAYLSTLISASDAVISPMSTLLLESLILEKPTMAIAFGDEKHRYNPSVTAQMTHMVDVPRCSAVLWCDNHHKLIKDVERLLRWRWDEKRTRSRNDLLDAVVTRGPGTYSDRLEEFCRGWVESLGRKCRADRNGVKRDTISHAYGAHVIAHRYCGVDQSESIVPGYWMHGWIPSYHQVHPAFVAMHKKKGQHEGYDYEAQIRREKEDTPQWVSRADEVEFLRAHGYRHVAAVGLPITYLPAVSVRRVQGSLLVLPPHGRRSHGDGDALAEQYADAIASVKPRFEHVWVGINGGDLSDGQWVEAFRRRGIDVFMTTDPADSDTLARLRRILLTFEYVTTNGLGSHIALAAYCGAKVSVYGPFAEFPRERMSTIYPVKMFPHLLDEAEYLYSERALREHYPFLFVEPDRAIERREWGAHEVGEPCRVPPQSLRGLFGWEMAVAP